jgi:tetratricopeptide (TPR) repeat protein
MRWAVLFLAIATTTPATTRLSREEQAAADLQQVQVLLEDGDRDSAIRRFTRVPQDLVDRVAPDLRAKIIVAADESLADVDRLLADKQFNAAAKRLRELLSVFAGLPTASLARQRLAELVATPQVVAIWQADERATTAQAALEDARNVRDAGDEEAAYAKFQQVASDFPGTPAAAAARAAVAAYDHDAAFQRRRHDHAAEPKARAALNLAENYRSAGRLDSARKKYEEVITQFPDTSFADTARQELNALK